MADALLVNAHVRHNPTLASSTKDENAIPRIRVPHAKMDARGAVEISPRVLEKVLPGDGVPELEIVARIEDNWRPGRHRARMGKAAAIEWGLDVEKVDGWLKLLWKCLGFH